MSFSTFKSTSLSDHSGGSIAASEVGVGAILGAPFMLGTLTMFVTGSAVWLFRHKLIAAEQNILRINDLKIEVAEHLSPYVMAHSAVRADGHR